MAVDQRSGERVILKEARPHAGLDADGVDAVGRLERERRMLERLHDLDGVPALHDSFTIGDHHFVAMEFIDGVPLSAKVVERFPLLTDAVDPAQVGQYVAWAVGICDGVEKTVASLHERGVVFRDLHQNNVLVRPDGAVVLIDFECAGDIDDGMGPALGDPGFSAPAGVLGIDVDRYALGCLRLSMFLPLTNIFAIGRHKAAHLAHEIDRLFPVPSGYLDDAVATITGVGALTRGMTGAAVWEALRPDVGGWERARASMAEAIVASATPERSDRLFPGDIRQFESGGLNLAYGAAGVLYALAEAGAGRWPAFEEWLIKRSTSPEPGTRLGFFDGLQGVAFVLDRLDHRAEAQKVLDISIDDINGDWDSLGLDLFGGLAGIGLNLHYLGERLGEPALSELAWNVADRVALRLGDEESVAAVSGGVHPYAGLLRGSSGPALLFIRLYEQTGDTALLDLASTALGQDLRRCVPRDDGALEVDEGWRTMPYLADGSVGVAMVIEEYLRHRHDERFANAAALIRRAAASGFFVEPGLFYGRAGMLLHLAGLQLHGAAKADPVVAEHIRRLGWHAVDFGGALAFPGETLLRLSMDLASGTAGILLALASVLHDSPVHLPFLRAGGGTRVDGRHFANQEKGGD